MTPERKAECLEAIARMEKTANVFYPMAIATNIHQFVEFTGFIREYIKICREHVDAGVDIFESALRPKPYQMEYVAEKLDCIYGHASPEAVQAFIKALKAHEWPV